eukprot:5306192-Pleurochrysis_carterae.AAC.1
MRMRRAASVSVAGCRAIGTVSARRVHEMLTKANACACMRGRLQSSSSPPLRSRYATSVSPAALDVPRRRHEA